MIVHGCRTRFGAVSLLSLALLALTLAPASPARADTHGAPAHDAKAPPTAPEHGDSLAFAQPRSFSVEMHVTKGSETIEIKRFVDGARSRMDISTKGDEMSIIDLGDEKGTNLMLMHSQKMALKQTRSGHEEQMKQARSKGAKKDTEAKADTAGGGGEAVNPMVFVGHETVNGKMCDKYESTFSSGTAYAWVDPETHQPVRMASKDGTVDFSNFKVAPQPAELFTAPRDYTLQDMDEIMSKASGMGGMMSGMMGGMGSSLGSSLGGGLGGMLGGPLGQMAGSYVGGKLGGALGKKVGGAVSK